MIATIDYLKRGKKLLLSQFEKSKTILTLLESWLLPLQSAEDSLHNFMSGNGISNARGDMLNVIGTWFDVTRQGRDDAEYRAAILARIISNYADGTTEKMLDGLVALTQSRATFYDYFPNTVYVHVGGGYLSSLYKNIKLLKPAGTDLRILLDIEHDCFFFAETLERDNGLVTGDGEQYLLSNESDLKDWVVNFSNTDKLENTFQYLAEDFESTGFYFADEIYSSPEKAIDSFAIRTNHRLVDHASNNITTISFDYKD